MAQSATFRQVSFILWLKCRAGICGADLLSARHFHKRRTVRKVIVALKNFCARDGRGKFGRPTSSRPDDPHPTGKIPSIRREETLHFVCLMESSLDCPERVSALLADWRNGDEEAFTRLIPLVYEDLRRLAHRHMAGQRPDHTLQTTALVNEAFLRLAGQTRPNWQDRIHFVAVAARVMRQILVSYARNARAQKRGGGAQKIELEEAALVSPTQSEEIVALNEALDLLASLDARKAEVVELKYFGGLSYDEIAELQRVSTVTVRRDWKFAKAWLYAALHGGR